MRCPRRKEESVLSTITALFFELWKISLKILVRNTLDTFIRTCYLQVAKMDIWSWRNRDSKFLQKTASFSKQN